MCSVISSVRIHGLASLGGLGIFLLIGTMGLFSGLKGPLILRELYDTA